MWSHFSWLSTCISPWCLFSSSFFVAETSVCKLLLGTLSDQLVAAQLSLFPSKPGVPRHMGRGRFPSPGCPPQASSEPPRPAHPAVAQRLVFAKPPNCRLLLLAIFILCLGLQKRWESSLSCPPLQRDDLFVRQLQLG